MPLRFTRQTIAAQPYEAADVCDVDGDGVLDIVSGAFWYQGPDFRRWHRMGDVAAIGEYYDDFSSILIDVDGDGRPDQITGGYWGDALLWRRNPGKAGDAWTNHVIATGIGNIETTRAWDIDGDGHLEILPNTPSHALRAYRLIRDAAGKGTGQFESHLIHDGGLGHGLGFGDIDGDGRGEILTPRGYLTAPKAGPWSGPWEFHQAWDMGGDASVPMLVADVNGDGINEVIVGRAHSYGLDWWQPRTGGGRTEWIRHPIDPGNSQYHDLHWADIDGDGQCELITGKRFRAHCGSDPGEFDDVGLYYFKWTGEGFAKQVISFGAHGVGKGCGIQFALADLRGTGRLDVIAPGKDGLAVFFNDGATPGR